MGKRNNVRKWMGRTVWVQAGPTKTRIPKGTFPWLAVDEIDGAEVVQVVIGTGGEPGYQDDGFQVGCKLSDVVDSVIDAMPYEDSRDVAAYASALEREAKRLRQALESREVNHA